MTPSSPQRCAPPAPHVRWSSADCRLRPPVFFFPFASFLFLFAFFFLSFPFFFTFSMRRFWGPGPGSAAARSQLLGA